MTTNSFVPIKKILNTVSHAADVSRDLMAGDTRRRRVVCARHAYCKLASQLSGHTLDEIGAPINRDHSTVTNSIKRVDEALTAKDPDLKQRTIKEIYSTSEGELKE